MRRSGRSLGTDPRMPRFKSRLCHGAAGWPWAPQPLWMQSLCFRSLWWKMKWNKRDPSYKLVQHAAGQISIELLFTKGCWGLTEKGKYEVFPIRPAGLLELWGEKVSKCSEHLEFWVLFLRDTKCHERGAAILFSPFHWKGSRSGFCLKRATSSSAVVCTRQDWVDCCHLYR